uniref:Interferon alpha inducible protein 27 like 2 n=1 Tax=Microcebus murinus TaxID=30608 RepID=A0A8C5Y781_MICMU
ELVVAAAVGGALPLAAVTLVLGSLGFTGSEIAASSTAAKMISPGAMANGGGECLGGLVATLQSVGKCLGQEDQSQDKMQPRG